MAEAATPAASTLAALGAQKAYGAKSPAKADDRLDAAAQDFEAVFLTQMMEQMFSGLGDSGPLGSGEGGSAYRSMLADQYGRTIAAAGGIGLADDVRRELIAIQQGGQSS
ncbi:rod-binding protein [Hansschlegelia beijingensis]|uniref:Rod binding domain-containing protein n=1 Tax=Hansschlegelia beijingensis TaxID=1133344 RepID=A0A7W6GFP9_9HYPH|nr:rod-binding protein [Hansschlegelia beijingensis]MBB3973520.1 Rod binding domain-containing protein [Hansschlegelia beijingensis]